MYDDAPRGHLRIRNGQVDFNGGRGKFAQFRAVKSDGLTLQNVGTGLFLHVEGGRFSGRAAPSVLDISVLGKAQLTAKLQKERELEEADLMFGEKRRKAAYALQSSR